MKAQGDFGEQVSKAAAELAEARQEQSNAKARLTLVREAIARANEKVKEKKREVLALVNGLPNDGAKRKRTVQFRQTHSEWVPRPDGAAIAVLRYLFGHSGTFPLNTIAEDTQRGTNAVSVALNDLKKRGFAMRGDGGWVLTREGIAFFEKHNPGIPKVQA